MLQTKSSRIEIRTNEETKTLIEKAAHLTGQSISAYILTTALSSAKHDIAEMETISIGAEDKDLFFSLLSDPPQPNEHLKRLFKG